jgi:hypothetical protein
MAYAVIVEISGGTLEQYDAMAAAMGFEGGETSAGLIVHFAGVSGGTLVVVDLWESKEAYERHIVALGDRAREAVGRIGLPPYTHREFEVYRVVK